MLEGFTERRLAVDEGIAIHTCTAGSGPPLLLLHGFPQTHVCWHKVAPRLAERFTVVATDLRGYGASSKPAGGPRHAAYSKRAMAADQVEVMRQLGFSRFAVVGHDRGARVAHRMGLDFPDRVERLAVLDIAPTATMLEMADSAFATAYYHWFFLIQPYDLPERLIGADPEYYLRYTLASWCKTPAAIDEAALAAYRAAFCSEEAIHAACEDYRAAVDVDLEHDTADAAAGRRLTMPLLAIWGAKGTVGRLYDVLATWRERSDAEVCGHALDCGHFVPEEAPEALLTALVPFLAAAASTRT